MTEIIAVLAGILAAAALFAALLWSLAQSFRERGPLRLAHIAAIAATILVMAFLTWRMPLPAQAAGAALALAGLTLLFLERRWNRLLPLAQLLAGLAVAAGLPFAASGP
ncbi:MAG: hypothetical protein ACQEUZ_03010 [Pseudomonadota bacterium]